MGVAELQQLARGGFGRLPWIFADGEDPFAPLRRKAEEDGGKLPENRPRRNAATVKDYAVGFPERDEPLHVKRPLRRERDHMDVPTVEDGAAHEATALAQ